MEEPRSGVVGDDAERDTLARRHLDGVTTDGVDLALVDGWVERWVVRGVVSRTLDDLELVSVQVAVDITLSDNSGLGIGAQVTYKGCLPASPFLRTISKTSMWLRTNVKGP